LGGLVRAQWQSVLELLWPSRSGPLAHEGRHAARLQAAIALAIAMVAGPEIFAAMEMTALLEVLGVSLFLTGFAAGARLAAMSVYRAACNIAFPPAQLHVIRSDATVSAKAQALIFCAVNATWWLGGILVLSVSARSIVDVVV
jgi:hypothetical protein